MNEELKRCPFCGGTNIKTESAGAPSGPFESWANCEGCGCSGPSGNGHGGGWNNRYKDRIVMPDFNRHVRAVIKPSGNISEVSAVYLIRVDESDCDWRFEEDNCELSYDWDVIYWEYLE